MHILLVVNPTASSMTSRRRLEVERSLFSRHRLEVAETVERDHATALARDAAERGVEVVVVLGGDGTVNEVANGLVGANTALAPLPGGSTNVYARSLGYPRRVRPAVECVLEALDTGRLHRVGVGSANGRRFLFHLGAGYDAAVVARMERRRPWIKRRLAHSAFAWTAFRTFMSDFDRDHPSFVVSTADETVVGEGFFAIVSKAAPYAFFGPRPLMVTRSAGIDRKLGLTLYRRLGAGLVLWSAFEAMSVGVRKHRNIVQLADLDAITMEATGDGFPWQVDGDWLGLTERLDVLYEPDALTLVLP